METWKEIVKAYTHRIIGSIYGVPPLDEAHTPSGTELTGGPRINVLLFARAV